MNSFASTGFAALLLCASPATLSAQTPASGTTLIIGDSLSDTGNAFRLTGGAFPDPAFYKDGRLSNGPVWADRLFPRQGYYADLLLGTPTAGPVDGWNFAVAGALSGAQTLDPETVSPPGVLTQVRDYRALVAAGRIPSANRARSAIIWAGANDYGTRATDPARVSAGDGAYVQQVVGNLRSAATSLISEGMREVVLINQFDFSKAPTAQLFSPEIRAAGDALTSMHNKALLDTASSLQLAGSASVIVVDVDRLFDDVFARPAAYGISNVTGPCLPDDGPPQCQTSAEADRRLFWDGTHLTSAGHALVAQTISGTRRAALEAPRQSAVLVELGLATAGAHRRAAEIQRATARPVNDRGLAISLTAADAREARGGLEGRSDYVWNGRTFGFGIEQKLTSTLRVSGLISRGSGDASIGGGSATARAKSITASGALSFQVEDTVAQVTAGRSRLTFRSRRDTAFGPAPTATGEANGFVLFADAAIATSLRIAAIALEPVLAARWTRIEVDGFDERSGGLMNVRVNRQQRESLVGSVGARSSVSIPIGSARLRPFAGARYEREVLDGSWRSVVTLQSGQQFGAIAGVGDRDWVNLEAGLAAALGERLEASASYQGRAAWSGDDVRAITASVKYRF